MVTFVRFTAVAALCLCIAVLSSAPAHALSCAPSSLGRSVRLADTVLVGKVLSFDGMYAGNPLEAQDVRVSVERYVKGSGPDVVTVTAYTRAWAGGWEDEDVGDRWLFFLRDNEDGTYTERGCSGSSQLNVVSALGYMAPTPAGLGVSVLLAAAGTVGLAYIRRL